MTAAPQLRPQFLEVVDLAVENSDDAPVFIRDRLLAPAQVDDAQAAHSERHFFVEIHAGIIGTTVANHLEHVAENLSVRAIMRFVFVETADATHSLVSGLSSWVYFPAMSRLFWVRSTKRASGFPSTCS